MRSWRSPAALYESRKSKVSNLQNSTISVVSKQQVFWFKIAVAHAPRVAVVDAAEELHEVVASDDFIAAFVDANAIKKLAAGRKFQNEKDGALGILNELEHLFKS